MGIWKDKNRGEWCWTFQYKGKTYGGRSSTKGEARTAREERRKAIKSQIPETLEGTDFKSVANLYLDYSKRRHAPKTYKGKMATLKAFLNHHGNTAIVSITPANIHSYLDTLVSNNTYNAQRKDICSMFAFAREHLKLPIPHPCWDLPKMPHTPARKIIPSEQQVLQMIMAADPETERPLLIVVIQTLGRVDEILRLTWQDVNFDKRSVTLWTRKRKGGAYEDDSIYMNNDLYDVLWGLWKKRKNQTWVFYNPDTETRYHKRPKMMRSICKRAFAPELKMIKDFNGPVFNFHSLRHFMASYLADKEKVSLKTISKTLRHKNLKTTEIYLHSIDCQRRSDKAYSSAV